MGSCELCSQDLVVELDDENSGALAPDDLQLACACHFHWQCLLDDSPKVALSLQCPACNASLISQPSGPSATNSNLPMNYQPPQILTRYQNEGGIQENLDILPLITEEAYLDAHPTARPARAFFIMCGEGDVTGLVELLNAIEEDRDEEDMTPAELVRYQDPLDNMKTGLHVAVEKNQQEVVWLLLWLASRIETHIFPGEVVHAAEELGATRETVEGVDIRSIRDERHQTAEDIARGMGNVWSGLVGAGALGC